MRQPKLYAENRVLAEIYYRKPYVTTKDIQEDFKVSYSTAWKAVRYCMDYAQENEIRIYPVPGVKAVPTELFFDAFHWNIKAITQKVKQGAKVLC